MATRALGAQTGRQHTRIGASYQPQFDEAIAANHESFLKSEQWGVPTFVYEGEPIFGQDRFDQLQWRMGLSQ